MSQVNSENKRTRKPKETRRRMLEAARELFVQRGCGATTLQEIASRRASPYRRSTSRSATSARCSKSWPTCRSRATTSRSRRWIGRGSMRPSPPRPPTPSCGSMSTAREGFWREWLRSSRCCAPPPWPTPGIAELFDQDTDPRFTVHATAARSLASKPGIRHGVTAEHAADLLFGLLSPELYLLFVRDRGWCPRPVGELGLRHPELPALLEVRGSSASGSLCPSP